MNTTLFSRGLLVGSLVLAVAVWGCEPDSSQGNKPEKKAVPKATSRPKDKPAEVKKVPFGKNVELEVQGKKRRVLLQAYVCLRQGQLEQLLTRRHTKEHEAILAIDADARLIHAALLAAGAQKGATVSYKRMGDKIVIIPPRGTPIKVTLQYLDKNKKQVTVPAQRWVRMSKTKKDLAHDWVFAGSVFIKDPFDPKKPDLYGANDGDVICVANFDTAMLDLPINSSKNNDDLAFEAHTERIPPLETKVAIILEPVLGKNKK
jgi:hypothetical protein